MTVEELADLIEITLAQSDDYRLVAQKIISAFDAEDHAAFAEMYGRSFGGKRPTF